MSQLQSQTDTATGFTDIAVATMAISREPLQTEEMTEGEFQEYQHIQGTAREKSWLRGRRALHTLLQGSDLSHVHFPNPQVSLTHSDELAIAVRLTPLAPPPGWQISGAGVDFEHYRRIKTASARFFLTAQEMDCLAPVKSANVSLLRLWTVKEALFKADADNRLHLIGDYEMEDVLNMAGKASRRGCTETIFHYWSMATKSGFLSLALSLRRS